VTLEGRVSLHKAGLVLETSGPMILLDYLGAADASWPTPGTHAQVTGVLRAAGDAGRDYPFKLERPQSKVVENSAR
jgi:hypothetical protein